MLHAPGPTCFATSLDLRRLEQLPLLELTDPGLWLGDDESIIVAFRAAAHGEALAASLTVCATCPSQRRVEYGHCPDIPKILGYQERRV